MLMTLDRFVHVAFSLFPFVRYIQLTEGKASAKLGAVPVNRYMHCEKAEFRKSSHNTDHMRGRGPFVVSVVEEAAMLVMNKHTLSAGQGDL